MLDLKITNPDWVNYRFEGLWYAAPSDIWCVVPYGMSLFQGYGVPVLRALKGLDVPTQGDGLCYRLGCLNLALKGRNTCFRKVQEWVSVVLNPEISQWKIYG